MVSHRSSFSCAAAIPIPGEPRWHSRGKKARAWARSYLKVVSLLPSWISLPASCCAAFRRAYQRVEGHHGSCLPSGTVARMSHFFMFTIRVLMLFLCYIYLMLCPCCLHFPLSSGILLPLQLQYIKMKEKGEKGERSF